MEKKQKDDPLPKWENRMGASSFMTSYQGRAKKDRILFPDFRQIAIMRFPQEWWNGEIFPNVAPSKHLLHKIKKSEIDWKEEYLKELSKFDVVDILERIGPRSILYCVEKDHETCHRSIFSEWLCAHTKHPIPEASTVLLRDSRKSEQLPLF